AGGRVVEQTCPTCKKVARFVECDVSDKMSVMFVKVLDMTSRRMVCTECGEDLDVPAPAAKGVATAPNPCPPSRAASAPAARERATPAELDRMLADLKKKMGADPKKP